MTLRCDFTIRQLGFDELCDGALSFLPTAHDQVEVVLGYVYGPGGVPGNFPGYKLGRPSKRY